MTQEKCKNRRPFVLNLFELGRERLSKKNVRVLLLIVLVGFSLLLTSTTLSTWDKLELDALSKLTDRAELLTRVLEKIVDVSRDKESGKANFKQAQPVDVNKDLELDAALMGGRLTHLLSYIYTQAELGTHGTIFLIDEQGVVKGRRKNSEIALGQNISNLPIFQKMRLQDHGDFSSTETVDQRNRVFAFKKLSNYPLTVSVGLDVEESLDAYRASRKQVMTQLILRILTIVGFCLVMLLMMSKLIKQRDQLIDSNRAQQRFVANITHELKTPMVGILGYSEILKEELSDPVQASFAEAIHESGSRLLALVNSVLELSNLDAEEVKVYAKAESLSEMLQETSSQFMPKASAKNIVLRLEMLEGLADTIVCDRSKLMRVLEILLYNALHFTDVGAGVISLTISPLKNGLQFAVRDSGRGMTTAMQKKAFVRFAQGDDSLTRTKEGIGMGLPIAALLVKAMGGAITVHSSLGQGSTFSFVLPTTTKPNT